MPCSCRCCAGPTPDNIMICAEPIEPAARMTSPRQRADACLRRPAASARRRRAVPSNTMPSTRQPVSSRRLLRLSAGLRNARRGRPAPAALLIDVERAAALVVAAVEVGNRFDAGLFGRGAKGVEQIPSHARRCDAPFAAGRVRVAFAQEMIFVPLEIRQHVVPAPAGQGQAGANDRSRRPGRACRSWR